VTSHVGYVRAFTHSDDTDAVDVGVGDDDDVDNDVDIDEVKGRKMCGL